MKLAKFLGDEYPIREDVKLITVWGGIASARTYALKSVEKILAEDRKTVYFLSEVEDSLWELFSYTLSGLQVIFWEKNSLGEDKIAAMLKEFIELPQKTIIVDQSDEVVSVFRSRKDVPRSKYRFYIDCNLPLSESDRMENFYIRWFKEVEKFDVSPRMVEHALSKPLSESFNTVNLFRWVGEKELNLVSLQKWGMLWTDEESLFVERLFIGRAKALKLDWRGLDAPRTLWLTYLRLTQLLKVKTLQTGYLSEKMAKVGVSRQLFYRLKDEAQKADTKKLYSRLYVVSNLLKWRTQKNILGLLLLHW